METASQLYNAAQDLRTGGREAARAALLAARERTLLLADGYAQALRPSQLRIPYRETLNPPLWEWGHVAWFQEWWIARNRERSRGVACDPDHARAPSVLPGADQLYDSSRVAHTTRWDLPLPGEAGTRAYMAQTLESTLAALEADGELYFYRLVALHEQMHAEAAVYMAKALGIAVPRAALRPLPALKGGGATVRVPAQDFDAGWQGPGFAFDNELQPQRMQLAAFEIDAEPVTWASFAEFVRADGYRDTRWWGDAGWAWLQSQEHTVREGPPAEAVTHVTAHEAQAWCRWAGRRLPTEFEWECAAMTQPAFAWGNAWEWTASPFEPYPGFTPHPYRDYSAPWFGSRRVLRGACAATSEWLAHPRYRNFFEPHRDDILSGFRSCA